MKKFLVVLTVLVLLASSVFAAVTTVTKEQSQAGYPGVLTKGSVTGTSTFIADLPLLANTVLFEYVDGIYGLVALKSDIGTIGLSVNPSIDATVPGISNDTMNTVGLQYAKDTDSMTLGAALLLGIGTYNYDNKDLVNNDVTWDKVNTSRSYVGVKLGSAFKGTNPIDLALGVAVDDKSGNAKNYRNVAGGGVLEETTNDSSLTALDLSAREAFGAGLTVAIGGNYVMGTTKTTDVTYDNAGTKLSDNSITGTNSALMLGALIGKEIKATDTLTVKIASGASLWVSQSAKLEYKDNMDPETTTYDTGWRWSEADVMIPLNVAVEGKLNETWTINAGTSATILSTRNVSDKYNVSASTNDPKEYYTESWLDISPELRYSLGVTGKIGDLTLDLMLNPMILIYGPNFISGNSLPGPMNYAVALSYNWK